MKNYIRKDYFIFLLCFLCFTTGIARCSTNPSSADYGNTNGNINNGGCLVGNDSYIFFVNSTQENGITRMDLDGSNPICVSPNNVHWMNLYKYQLYFIQDNDQCMYKMNLDGSSCTKISTIKAKQMTLAYDWIFFLNVDDESKIYKIKADGTESTEVSEEGAQQINIVDHHIYYLQPNNQFYLYEMSLDGSNNHCILEQSCRSLVATTDYLFYSTYIKLENGNTKPRGIHRMNRTNPLETITIQKQGGFGGINVQGDSLYFIDDSESFAGPLMKSSLHGEDSTVIINGHCAIPEITDHWITTVKTLYPTIYSEDRAHFDFQTGTIFMLFNQESKEWISVEEPLY